MPEITEPERWVIPGIVIAACIGAVVQLCWERWRPTSYPGSRAHRAALREASAGRWEKQMAWWADLPTGAQARYDAAAIDEGMTTDELDQAMQAREEETVRLAVQRATEINTLTHP